MLICGYVKPESEKPNIAYKAPIERASRSVGSKLIINTPRASMENEKSSRPNIRRAGLPYIGKPAKR